MILRFLGFSFFSKIHFRSEQKRKRGRAGDQFVKHPAYLYKRIWQVDTSFMILLTYQLHSSGKNWFSLHQNEIWIVEAQIWYADQFWWINSWNTPFACTSKVDRLTPRLWFSQLTSYILQVKTNPLFIKMKFGLWRLKFGTFINFGGKC